MKMKRILPLLLATLCLLGSRAQAGYVVQQATTTRPLQFNQIDPGGHIAGVVNLVSTTYVATANGVGTTTTILSPVSYVVGQEFIGASGTAGNIGALTYVTLVTGTIGAYTVTVSPALPNAPANADTFNVTPMAVQLSKNGGTPVPPLGALGEVGLGLYKVVPNATDNNTLGVLALHAQAFLQNPATAPTVTAPTATGGNFATSTQYFAAYSYTTPFGETITSPTGNVTTGATAGNTYQISVSIPSIPANATGVKVYAGTVSTTLFQVGTGTVSPVVVTVYQTTTSSPSTTNLGALSDPNDVYYDVQAINPNVNDAGTAATQATAANAATTTLIAATVPYSSTVNDGASTTTVIDTALTGTADLTGNKAVFINGALKGVYRTISSMNTGTGQITLLTALSAPPANGVGISIVQGSKALEQMLAALGTDNRVKISTDVHSSGVSIAGTQTFNNTGTWTGNLSGSVGSVTGNVNGSVASILGVTLPLVVPSLAQIQAGVPTDTSVQADANTALLALNYTAARGLKLDNLDVATSTRSTYAGADTAGTTTLLTRVPGVVQPQTGDTFARIGAAGAGLTAVGDTAGTTTLLTRILGTVAAQSGDAFARIGALGAGLTALGDTRLANLDAAVSSRSTYAGADTAGTTTLLSRLTQAILFDASGYAKSSVWAYNTGLDPASSVWGAGSRTLSAFAFQPTIGGYAAGQDPATSVWESLLTAHNTALTFGNKVQTSGAGADTPGTTTLLSRIPGTVAAQTGDAFARIGAAGAGLTALGPVTVGGYAAGQDPATLLFGSTFTTIPANHTIVAATGLVGSTPLVLTWKQMQALTAAINIGDNTSNPPVVSGTAIFLHYVPGQPKIPANLMYQSTVTYDAAKQQASNTILIASPFPAIP